MTKKVKINKKRIKEIILEEIYKAVAELGIPDLNPESFTDMIRSEPQGSPFDLEQEKPVVDTSSKLKKKWANSSKEPAPDISNREAEMVSSVEDDILSAAQTGDITSGPIKQKVDQLSSVIEPEETELREAMQSQEQKRGTYIIVVPKRDIIKQIGGASPGPSGRGQEGYKAKIQKGQPYWAYIPRSQEEVDAVSGTDTYDDHIYNPGRGFWPEVSQGAIVLQYMFTGRPAPRTWVKEGKANGFPISQKEVEQISDSDPRAKNLFK